MEEKIKEINELYCDLCTLKDERNDTIYDIREVLKDLGLAESMGYDGSIRVKEIESEIISVKIKIGKKLSDMGFSPAFYGTIMGGSNYAYEDADIDLLRKSQEES